MSSESERGSVLFGSPSQLMDKVGKIFCSNEAYDPKPQGKGHPCIELIGPELVGKGKYLGGELAEDSCIYGMPGHAKRVLRICCVTQKVSLVGPEYEGKYKWLRAAKGSDGALYGIPCHADRVLRVLPRGNELDPDLELVGPEFLGEWLWHGGCTGSDGAIYAIPQSASRVLRIQVKPSLKIDLVGPDFQGKWKWYGGIASSSCIFGIPACADSVLRIRTFTNGQDPLVDTIGSLPPGGWKWHGGVRTADGSVWGSPSNANSVLKIGADGSFEHNSEGATDESTKDDEVKANDTSLVAQDEKKIQVSTIGKNIRGGRHRDDDKYKYLGAVVGPDGCVYCVPSDADSVLKIDPSNGGSISEFGEDLGYLSRGNSRGQNKWQNGALLADGFIYCIPLKAEVVLRLDVYKNQIHLFPHPAKGLNLWEGGVLGDDGALYCMPLNAEKVLRIAPAGTQRVNSETRNYDDDASSLCAPILPSFQRSPRSTEKIKTANVREAASA